MAGIAHVITSDSASGAQVIDGSLKFDNSKTTNLSRTPGSEGNRKTWTWSGWFNRQNVGANDNIFKVAGSSNKATQFTIMIHNGNYVSIDYGGAFYLKTNRLLRDTSGWYNFVVTVDTTLGTADNRIRLYINGVEETSFATRNNPNQNEDLGVNRTSAHTISTGDSNGFDGLLSNFYLIDGQALGPGYFGYTDPLTNTWKPKKYTGSTNDTTYPNNINTNFSSSLSASSGFNASYPANNAFDGNLESFASSAGGSQYLELSSSFTGVTSLRIQCAAGSGFDMEGETYTISGTGITSKDITTNSEAKSLTSISLTSTTISGIRVTSSSGLQARIVAIEINGIILKNNAGWGLNGFYLPMDGNSPIGQDQSGNGNDWTPVNFGGSVALDNPQVSGAKPILNTTPGGTQAGVGVFGSKQNVGYAVTVYDDGGGNKYYIDGVKQATLNGLIRGATYTFDTSDSTLGSTHPFRLSATSAHGTEYTNGVLAVTGTATTITVPYNAPNTLYYYCTAHSGMGSSITGITTNEKLADQYASNVTLALPLVGSDDDVCASIACTANNKTPTNSSVTAATTQSNFYSGSHYWSANSDTLQYAEQGNELVFGSGDYTIECWLYDDNGHNGTSNRCYIFDNRIGGSVVGDPPTMTGYIDSHNEFNFGDGTNTITHTVPSTVGKWWHYAVTREGTTTRMFIDGILRGSATSSTNFTNNGIGVGRATDANYGFAGYIQDFRVYTGVAKYTSNFVPAATNPDILPDTPSGVSGSSKLTKITDGSVSFDGTGDYLSLSPGADFAFGTGDFTIEVYLYYNGAPGQFDYIIDGRNSGQTTGTWTLSHDYVNDGSGLLMFSTDSSMLIKSSKNPIPNKWSHIAVSRSGTSLKMFIDGEQTASATNSTDFSTAPTTSYIGARYSNQHPFDGFMSNIRIIKGTALYTSRFTPPTAPLTNVTNTKLLCCQSNTSATEGAVKPGTITANGDAAATTFNPFTTDIHTVRGQETGYPTWSPLVASTSSFSDGNLKITTQASGYVNDLVTMRTPAGTGRWYWEFVETARTGSPYTLVGMLPDDNTYKQGSSDIPQNCGGIGLYIGVNGVAYVASGAATAGTTSATFGVGDILGWAYDAENGTVECYKNGVSQGTQFTNVRTDTGWTFCVTDYDNTTVSTFEINFGQKPFKYAPPDGYQSLNDANTRPTTVITRPDKYVGITTWKGDDQASHVINDLNFDGVPDFVWIKRRDGNSVSHQLYDTIRGATKPLVSSSTAAEDTQTSGLKAFVRNGFELGASSVVNGLDGDNGNVPFNYVAWCWKAGGNKNTFNVDDVGYASAAAAGLTAGTITPTGASVGTKQGFSIIKYTGTLTGTPGSGSMPTVPHGLQKEPTLVIAKATVKDASHDGGDWFVWHHSTNLDFSLDLNLGAAGNAISSQSGGTMVAPTTSVFSTPYLSGINAGTGSTYIAYFWHDVPGLQKFGTYSGNSNADGPFIELGFRPALFVMKQTDSTGYWMVYDSARDPINNGSPYYLFWNDNSAHGTGYDLDFLSNGVKLRTDNANFNTNSPYIYMAWAEAPTIDLYGGGSSAR